MSSLWKFCLTIFMAVLVSNTHAANLPTLPNDLQVGDIVFIRVKALPFRKVAEATRSWTNHVGIVTGFTATGETEVGESTFPRSRITTLSAFVDRSENKDVTVLRLHGGLNDSQKTTITAAAGKRLGIAYDTGFDLHSDKEFCSRFVREVIQEATGITLGEVETFSTLLSKNPQAGLGFWRTWFFGRIPWERETVTPASILASHLLDTHFSNRPEGGQR